MSATRNRILQKRQERKMKRRRRIYSIIAITLALVAAFIFFVPRESKEPTVTSLESSESVDLSLIDPVKSKGDIDAPVLVVEYGDFQ